jgi:hypothetical protein
MLIRTRAPQGRAQGQDIDHLLGIHALVAMLQPYSFIGCYRDFGKLCRRTGMQAQFVYNHQVSTKRFIIGCHLELYPNRTVADDS